MECGWCGWWEWEAIFSSESLISSGPVLEILVQRESLDVSRIFEPQLGFGASSGSIRQSLNFAAVSLAPSIRWSMSISNWWTLAEWESLTPKWSLSIWMDPMKPPRLWAMNKTGIHLCHWSLVWRSAKIPSGSSHGSHGPPSCSSEVFWRKSRWSVWGDTFSRSLKRNGSRSSKAAPFEDQRNGAAVEVVEMATYGYKTLWYYKTPHMAISMYITIQTRKCMWLYKPHMMVINYGYISTDHCNWTFKTRGSTIICLESHYRYLDCHWDIYILLL